MKKTVFSVAAALALMVIMPFITECKPVFYDIENVIKMKTMPQQAFSLKYEYCISQDGIDAVRIYFLYRNDSSEPKSFYDAFYIEAYADDIETGLAFVDYKDSVEEEHNAIVKIRNGKEIVCTAVYEFAHHASTLEIWLKYRSTGKGQYVIINSQSQNTAPVAAESEKVQISDNNNAELLMEISILKEERDKLNAQASTLLSDNEDLKTQLESLTEEKSELFQKVEELSAENKDLKQALEEYYSTDSEGSENLSLLRQNDELRKLIRTLTDEIGKLKDQIGIMKEGVNNEKG